MHKNGTYVALYLSNSSAQRLVNWCAQQEIDHQASEEMHCTLCYSKTPVSELQQFHGLSVQTSAKIKGWRQLGNALALELDFPQARRLNRLITAAGATSDFPSYIAHTTINPEHSGTELPTELPDFDLKFDRVHVAELDTDQTEVKENVQQLDELNMSPGALMSFAGSAAATGIRIGFEAEIIAPDVSYSDDDEAAPDWDQDSAIMADTYSQLKDSLSDFFGESLTRRDIEEALSEIADRIFEGEELGDPISNTEFRQLVADDLGVDEDSEEVDDEITDQGSSYYNAYDNMRDDFQENWNNLRFALRQLGLAYYSNWSQEFSWPWPYYTSSSTEGSEDIEAFGERLEDDLNISVQTGSGYKSVARGDHWIVETDPSISGDGAPLEIISPPMDLGTGLQKLQQFLDWASSNGLETNRSTGLHVGVSLPAELHQNIDYVKLILLLGDRYVLDRFDRSSNTYTQSALERVSQALRRSAGYSYEQRMPELFDRMRRDLSNHARTYFRQALVSTDKYVSVNIKDNYIEFRSMGGDYLSQKQAVINTVMRYVRVIAAAANDAEAREEYAKKFYKLARTAAPANIEDQLIGLFALYSAGKMPAAALKSFVRSAQQRRKEQRTGTATEGQYTYELYKPGEASIHRLRANNSSEAHMRFEQWAAEQGENLNRDWLSPPISAVISRVSESISETIRKQGSKYVILSQSGKKKLGTYNTRSAAEKRLRQIEYFKQLESKAEPTESPIDSHMLDRIERYADQLFADVGIDVEFTRHFVDRLHDERNRKPITANELAQLFKRERDRWGQPIAQLGPNAQAVMQDMRTNINIPFVLRWDAKNQELDLIAKTIMRKKNFQTSNRRFVVNSKNQDMQTPGLSAVQEFVHQRAAQIADYLITMSEDLDQVGRDQLVEYIKEKLNAC